MQMVYYHPPQIITLEKYITIRQAQQFLLPTCDNTVIEVRTECLEDKLSVAKR